MSVLSFPRLYFKGFMGWNPNTCNNNDYLPTYDPADAALGWEFLGEQNPPITPENFRDAFRPWAIKPLADLCPVPNPGPSDTCTTCTLPQGKSNPNCHMPSRWNYYGDNGCFFVQYQKGDKRTLTSGGDLDYGKPAPASDPILGKPIVITGNTFGGRTSPARLIDINPISPFCSQIYLASLRVGDEKTWIGGPPSQRMFSRSFMVPRNISGDLMIAGAIGVIFQTTVPRRALSSANGEGSELLTALLDAMQASGAAGLMLRFSTYNTVYYQNGIFNDIPEQPRTCDDITKLYAEGKVFINPAYSQVAGVIGIWNDGELATAPGGHMLVPRATLTPVSASVVGAGPLRRLDAARIQVRGHAAVGEADDAGESADVANPAAASGPPPLALGVVMAEIDGNAGLVSLDLMNAIPERDLAGTKFDYGPIDVGVQLPDGKFHTINTFCYDQYDLAAYQAKGGIVDVPFGPGVTAETVRQWLAPDQSRLALRAQGKIASLETSLTVQTDDRGVYVDQCRTQQIRLQVRYKNGLPPAGTRVRIAQYYPWPLLQGTGSWVLFGTEPPPPPKGDCNPLCDVKPEAPYLAFPDGDVVSVDAGGNATVRVAANAQGFPNIAFYPFLPGQAPPQPPSQVGFSFNSQTPDQVLLGTAFYSAVRVMPFDNALPAELVDRWNGTGKYAGQPKYDRLLTWQFIYGNILYAYDMIYPVMDQFMPLGNLVRIEGAVDQLVAMIADDMVDQSTLYMPVTRELSAGKRLVLATWGNLIIRKYPPEALPPLSVKCDP